MQLRLLWQDCDKVLCCEDDFKDCAIKVRQATVYLKCTQLLNLLHPIKRERKIWINYFVI